jgi:hypothetical protein
MMRPALIAILFLAACKNDPSQASPPQPLTPIGPADPSNTAPVAAPAAPATAHGDTPRQTEPRALAKLPDGRVALGPFSMLVPPGWVEQPSTSSMRAAHYRLPAAGGADAELIVYYFGENGAGSVQDNIDRWLSQFKQADGRASREVAKVEQARFAGEEGSLVSVSGHYVAPAMPGGQAVDKPDQALLAAIVKGPHGPYYFRLIGGQPAVAAHTAQFRETLASLKLR